MDISRLFTTTLYFRLSPSASNTELLLSPAGTGDGDSGAGRERGGVHVPDGRHRSARASTRVHGADIARSAAAPDPSCPPVLVLRFTLLLRRPDDRRRDYCCGCRCCCCYYYCWVDVLFVKT